MFVFPIAKSLFYVECLRKCPEDDIRVSTRMKCWGHKREVSEMVTGKSQEGFS